MRKSIKLALGTSILGLAAPAGAATFFFNSGNYQPGVTSPSPLLAPDTLEMNTAGNKIFSGVNFTNQSGTVNWNGGGVFIGNGATILNQSLWNITFDGSMANNGGALSTFTNSGIFRKSTGAGVTTIGSFAFVNSGVIDAQTGSIVFQGGTTTFNAGTSFTGAGAVNITNNANFNGAFSSTNLNLNSGTFTGTGAVLSGAADWNGGTFTGDWTIGSGATLNAMSASNKILNAATVVNDGTVNWQGGTLFLGNGSAFTNNGLFDVTAASMSISNNGGALSTFTNSASGQFAVNAGSTATVGHRFVNDGGTITSDGTINFTGGNAVFNAGTVFDGTGSTNITNNANFNGAFSSTNLNLNTGTFTGTGAVLSGAADWNGGTLTGGWTIGSGATLNVLSASNKVLSGGTLTNNGTLTWDDGSIFLGNGAVLTNAGTMTITGNDAFFFNGGAAVAFVNTGLIEKTAGGTTMIASNVGFDNNGTMNVTSGTIALPTNFTNDGTLAGTGSYTVAGITGLTNNGTIAPGDLGATGTLGLTGNYVQTGMGTLSTQLASSVMFDLFNITGSAALNGTLALSCIMGCNINTGDSFVILNSNGALSGMFSNVTTSGFLDGFSYDVIYDYANSEVRLSILDAGMNVPGGIPEPATWAMLILGFGVIGCSLRRRASRRVSLVFLH